jgi:peptide/nickel transport system substrate-binding protein
MGPLLASGGVAAQGRTDRLVIVMEAIQNSLDPHGLAVSEATRSLAWMTSDRLVGFGLKEAPGGGAVYDVRRIAPELAERWSVAANGLSITLTLREGALFHDGTPVTAADVKWSLDRAVSNAGAAAQLRVGGLERPEQFVVIDPLTLRVDLAARNPLALATLGLVQASVLNAGLCRRHATESDPWAQAWVRMNAAGGGAYRVNTWSPRTETVLVRNEAWGGGRLPAFKQVVLREAPSAGNRRAMLLQGDADLTPDLPVRDVAALSQAPNLAASNTPTPNTMYALGMNTKRPPFNDVRVRQAIAAAIPYQAILDTALLGRGRKLWGGPDPLPQGRDGLAWPLAFPTRTDPERARALLLAADVDSGLEITLSYDLETASIDEPVALLVQEALKAVNVTVAIDRRPAGTMPALVGRQELGLYLFQYGTWFDQVESIFEPLYGSSTDATSNGAAYRNPEMDRLIAAARDGADDQARDAARRRMIEMAIRDIPYAPIVQPYPTVVTQRSVKGFVTMQRRQVDARTLRRG